MCHAQWRPLKLLKSRGLPLRVTGSGAVWVPELGGVPRCIFGNFDGYARIDLRLAEDGRVYVLEANPNPQLAAGEDFAEAAASAGIRYGPLLERILRLGLSWEPSYLG